MQTEDCEVHDFHTEGRGNILPVLECLLRGPHVWRGSTVSPHMPGAHHGREYILRVSTGGLINEGLTIREFPY